MKVGDLSGKHGNFTAPIGMCNYNDAFISLDSSQPGYIGGRSVVIHKSDLSRFVCAKYSPRFFVELRLVLCRLIRRIRFRVRIVLVMVS
jgi:hypothetical protein